MADETVKKKKRSNGYSKTKGNAYERLICNELKALGYEEVVTSRSESKRMDNDKIDLVDPSGELPYIQLKKTLNIPSYFKLKDACSRKDKPFIVIWNAQELKEGNVNITSKGEVVILPKEYFYQLIKK